MPGLYIRKRTLILTLFKKKKKKKGMKQVSRKLPSIYVFSYFPFGFEGRMWDLIVSVPESLLIFLPSTFKTI